MCLESRRACEEQKNRRNKYRGLGKNRKETEEKKNQTRQLEKREREKARGKGDDVQR